MICYASQRQAWKTTLTSYEWSLPGCEMRACKTMSVNHLSAPLKYNTLGISSRALELNPSQRRLKQFSPPHCQNKSKTSISFCAWSSTREIFGQDTAKCLPHSPHWQESVVIPRSPKTKRQRNFHGTGMLYIKKHPMT